MAYLGKTPSQAVRSRYYYTATGGETSLSGADDNSNVLTFTDGNYVDVSLNGATLVAGSDYNTTTANTIGGLAALTASDIVEVLVYDTFSVFGGNMAANLNFKDNVKANFGTGNDLVIYHDGSNSILDDVGTGNLQLQISGSPKLEVTTSGIDVTGTITADGLTSVLSGDTQGKFSGWSVVGAYTASGAIELGQTSAYQGLISYAANGSTRFIFDNTYGSAASTFEFRTNTSATPKTHMKITGGGDISFYEDTGTSAKFFWDASAESLGIGTSSPAGVLDVRTGGTQQVIIGNSGSYTGSEYGELLFKEQNTELARVKWNPSGNTFQLINNIAGPMTFATNNTERLRIDSSGNLLVGKTSSSATTQGIEARADGRLWVSTSSDDSIFNRAGTDGGILSFRKDGTVVGSIASRAGAVSSIVLDPRSGGGGLTGGGAALYPTDNAGAPSDGVLSLGDASARFNNLFLSGGVYLGGTGSANYLDDYEEGTWTPVFTSSGTTPSLTYIQQNGYYVKVGQQVTIWGRIVIDTISSAGTGNLRVGGLPFTVNDTVAETGGSVGLWLNMSSSTGYETLQQVSSQPQLFVMQNTTNSSHSVTAMANNGYLRFTTSYIV